MGVYADVVFLVNFVMNSFILWAVVMLSRRQVRYLRLVAGGAVMALMYLLSMILLPYSWWMSLVLSLFMLSLGVLIALRPCSFRIFLGQLLIGYICSFTIGGLGMMILQHLSSVSLLLLIVCILVAYVLIKIAMRLAEGLTIKKQMLCPLTIYIGEEAVPLLALVDTGHTLHEPLGNAPVIIAEFESVKDLLPDKLRLMFYEQQENDLAGLLGASTGSRFYERIRMIPYVSLGLANGMLIGFRPDRVSLPNTNREDVVVGIYNRKLSKEGRYQGLISPELAA